jgi:hypothetical protein
MKRLFLSIASVILLTLIFFLIGAFFSGGGHSLTAITIFFPYSGLLAPSLKDTHWEFLLMILMTAQFPVYALLIAYTKGARRNIVGIIIPLVHTVVAVIALQLYESSKPGYGVLLPTVAIQQSLAADGAIACFSSNLFPSA